MKLKAVQVGDAMTERALEERIAILEEQLAEADAKFDREHGLVEEYGELINRLMEQVERLRTGIAAIRDDSKMYDPWYIAALDKLLVDTAA